VTRRGLVVGHGDDERLDEERAEMMCALGGEHDLVRFDRDDSDHYWSRCRRCRFEQDEGERDYA